MKTLILVSDIFNIGGIQQYNKLLCGAMETAFRGSDFTAVSLWDTDRHGAGLWRNIKIVYCGMSRITFLRKAVFVVKTAIAVFKEKPGFLICAHRDFAHLALLLKKIFGLKYAVVTYGTDVWKLKRGLKYSGLKNADVITAISRYTKNAMVQNGISQDRIRFLKCAIDTSLFRQKPKNEKLIDDLKIRNKRVLLTVGRISSEDKYKGHQIMLEVLAALGEEYVWLVIGGGDDEPLLRQRAREMRVIEKVRFLGEIEGNALIDYYNLCDVFVMPSKGEGFGIVFLEAMACGKPVITGNKDGSADALIDGRLGFMVDPDSVEEIIKAVNLIFTVKENRTSPEYLIKETGKNFGIDVFNKTVKDIFSEFIL
ncbi:MAG: glycosyltransferase family 4 protein [Candidatus Omnitrophica bacterium]|nr:glycosyltransferase family 4 protein [Candidatus Omnitrophota bacterium]